MQGILITGAAQRIGRALAIGLACDGWHILLHFNRSGEAARETAAIIEGNGGTATPIQADLAVESEREALIARAFSACGDVYGLINNASKFEYDTVHTATPQSLMDNFKVNAVAPFHLCQAFSAKLAAPKQGCIINMLDNKVLALNPDYLSYTIGKYALYGMTQILAMELAPRIRVCAIAPGITLVSGKQTQDDFETAHTLNPLGRSSSPGDLLQAARFIFEHKSVNGQVITIDGGEHLRPHGRDVAFVTNTANDEN